MLGEETKRNVKSKNEDYIAESLNNKKPFKAIIDSLSTNTRNGRNLRSYVYHAVRMRLAPGLAVCESDFLCPSQPKNAFTEEFDGQLNPGFFEPSYKSLHPYMITKVANIGKSDPVTELLRTTDEWIKKWSNFKRSYTKQRKSSRSYKWFGNDVLHCPKYFVDMAAHIENKPDSFFHEGYNWYYGGNGNFGVVAYDGSDYIISSELNCLKVSPFFKDNFSINYDNTVTFKCGEDTNIFETVYSQNIIALRTKFKIIILKFSIDTEIKLEKISEITSQLPYTSLSFDEHHKNILYATALDYQLTIINIDRMTKKSVKLRSKFPTLADNWNSVIGAERGCFLHVTKKALTLYDKRTNEPYQRYKSLVWVSDVLNCMQITTAKYCHKKPLLYAGTVHELFLIDMRCTRKKEENMKPVQRWTHGMMSPPVYLDICNYTENKEAVCVSSQWFEDMCVVTNYSDRITRRGEILGLSMPYRPPSLLKTYQEAHRQRLCCSVDESLRLRLSTSITGVALVTQDDDYSVLMQNSLGDISCHNLYLAERLSFIEDDSAEKLHEWSKQFREAPERPFQVSSIVDIGPLLKKLRQVPDDFIIGRRALAQRNKFNEDDIYKTYQQEKLDPAFLEVWKDKPEEITLKDTNNTSLFFQDP